MSDRTSSTVSRAPTDAECQLACLEALVDQESRVERQSFVDDLVMEDLVAHRDELRDQVKREREGAKQ